MKKKLEKKKGSALVLVLLITAALMTIGSMTITTMGMNVKVRVEENKRVQSLYGADAGIEWANNLLMKTYETAAAYAEKKVQLELGQDTNTTQEQLNTIFKLAFIDFLTIKDSDSNVVSNEFLEAIKNKSYISKSDKSETKKIEFSSSTTTKEPILSVTGNTIPNDQNEYVLTLASKFESIENGINNERQVQVDFTIKIPDYQGQYISESLDIYSVFHDKVITIDENMEVTGGTLIVNGDVFVVGNRGELANVTYDKYKGGITLSGVKATFNEDVITSKTLNVNQGSEVTLNKNLYGANLYVGNIDGSSSKGTVVLRESAILDNDLALKANDSSVQIKDFYGLNDKTYELSQLQEDDQNENVSRTSSSIIVNGNENSALNITNSAYIMGVAYINTVGEKYKTGESVAVKGNYLAYTHPLLDSTQFKDAEFKYYEPLQLVDSLNGTLLTTVQKSDYFLEFASQNKSQISSGNVSLPTSNVYAAGAIVSQQGENVVIEKSMYDHNANSTIADKRKEYASEVYTMGNMKVTDESALATYDSLGYGTQETVYDLINWGTLERNCTEKLMKCNSEKIKAITDGKILVLGSNSSASMYNDATQYTQVTGSDLEAFIITNGDVIIDGALDFTGNIISTGNLTIRESGEKKLTYDAATTQKILTQNYDIFRGVFKGDALFTQLVNEFTEYSSAQYSASTNVKSHNWKIIK